MTSTVTQYIYPSQLTPVVAASELNYSATYYNGPADNGVGATLTTAGSAGVDLIDLNVGDRVLFWKQTNAYENGIYVVTVAGGANTVYTRADDFQSIEQIKPGYNVAVQQGSTQAGMVLTVRGPQIQNVGSDSIVFVSASEVGPYRIFLNDELKIEHNVASENTTFRMVDSIVGDSVFELDCEGTTRRLTLGGNIDVFGNLNTGGPVSIFGGLTTNQATTINTFGAALCNTAAYSNALSELKVLYLRSPTTTYSGTNEVIAMPGVTANSVVVANLNSPSTAVTVVRAEPGVDQVEFFFSSAPGAGCWMSIIAIAIP